MATPPGETLRSLGGVEAIISTASSTDPVAELLTGLRPHGKLILIGVDAGSLTLPVAPMVMHAQTVTGWLTGSPADTEQAMAFAARHDIRTITQTYPITEAQTAVEMLRDSRARFRIVLVTDHTNPEETS
ncbi:zinc-binding dehydrogenase [Corynebacterium sp. CNJ-954]|uniref:zinc-binding dehydrogenase n=1 Tax=Corynebacterium sp. CNJ-954 TaxID=1904962 RepID=UPI002101844C|nr:zinc-binding dehydrogenase [Corynebacterium sp. CNJ-954]